MTTIERARLEELLAKYWEIAFEESSGVTPTGSKANGVLHEIRAVFDAQSAEIDRLRKDAERKQMTPEQVTNMVKEAGYCGASPQVEAAFINAIRWTETFHGIKGTP